MAAADVPAERTGRARRLWGPADFVTVLRLPLTIVFVTVSNAYVRLAVLAVAALSDLADGWIARRWGSSRAGPVLDPVLDKLFTVTAVMTVVGTRAGQMLEGWEIAGVLLRDLAVLGGFIATRGLRRHVTIPARLSGKCVTVLQFATLGALLLEWQAVRPLAWTTAVASAWAIADYAVVALRLIREQRGRA